MSAKVKAASKAHAKYSASGSKRWVACPGSIALSEKAPEPTESKYAIEGTKAHEVLEFLLKNRKKALAAAETLRKKYPMQMVIHAEAALKYVERRLAQFPGAELHIEVKVDLPVCEPGQFGTADIAIVEHFGRLIIIDYKYGAGIPVYPTEKDGTLNSQLVYYALGVAAKFDFNFSSVELVILQPRREDAAGETIRSVLTTVEALETWRDKFEAGIERCKLAAKEPEKHLVAAPLHGDDYCRFCPAAPICPEIKNKALRQAQADFADAPDGSGGQAIAVPEKKEAKLIPIQNLGYVLAATYRLETWISAVREHAHAVLTAGKKINGFSLGDGRTNRVWADEDKAKRAAYKLLGIAPFDLMSPAQFEKAFSSSKIFDSFFEKHVVKVVGNPVIKAEAKVAKPAKATVALDDLGF